MNSDYILLSSTLLGSIYLFSVSYKISNKRYYKKFDGYDAINISIMLFLD